MEKNFLFKGKVLLVDDEEEICETLELLLRKLGFNVCTACSAGKAVKLIKEDKDISFVLVDLQMPEINGDEFIREAKKLLKPETKYIIITGDVNCRIDDLNADALLTKPFTKNNLMSTLSRFL